MPPRSNPLNKAEQDAKFDKLSTDIAAYKRNLAIITPAVEFMESEMNEMIKLMPGTNAMRASMKSDAGKFKVVRQLRIDCKGLNLIIGDFEKVFKKEWKSEQYKSLDKREVYLKEKVAELEGLEKRFKRDVEGKVTAARIRIAGWNEDEVWPEDKGEGEDEAEVEAGAEVEGEDGEESTPASQSLSQVRGKLKVEVEEDVAESVDE